MLLKPDYINY